MYTYSEPIFRHKQEALLQVNEIEGLLDIAFPKILEQLENYMNEGSGWNFERVQLLWLDIAKYEPPKGGSYIPLPSFLANKKAIINVKNNDDNCLRWALKSTLFPVAKNPQRTSSYPSDDKDGLDLNSIDSPTPVSQIRNVEKQNNLAINVFGFEKGTIIIHYLSKMDDKMQRTNLMLIEDGAKFH